MQLPRGTFREIKKHTKFGVLFEELQQTRFSGICTISFGKVNGIIVFKSGKRILAEYENFIGDSAWDELQKIVEETVDVALSTLDAAQIELSLEFNKSYRILSVGKAEHPHPQTISSTHQQSEKKPPVHPVKQEKDAAVKNNLIPAISESTTASRSVTAESHHTKEPSKKGGHTHPAKTSHKHSAPVSPHSKGYSQSEEKKEISQEEKSSSAETNSLDFDKDIQTFEAMGPEAVSNFDRDIDTFETMDLEAITNKIRVECKDIIKQLNLEHLKEER
jgi:hypothetical protein